MLKKQARERALLSEMQMKLKRCVRACERFEGAKGEEELFEGDFSKLEHENEIERVVKRRMKGERAGDKKVSDLEENLWIESLRKGWLKYKEETEKENEKMEENLAQLKAKLDSEIQKRT